MEFNGLDMASMEAVLQNLPDAVIFTDMDRRIRSSNTAFQDLFGYRADELIGQSTRIIYADEKDFLAMGEDRASSRPGKEGPFVSVVLQNKQGALFHSDVKGVPVASSDGQMVGMVAMIRDISRGQRIRILMDELVSISNRVNSQLTDRFRNVLGATGAFAHAESIALVHAYPVNQIAHTVLWGDTELAGHFALEAIAEQLKVRAGRGAQHMNAQDAEPLWYQDKYPAMWLAGQMPAGLLTKPLPEGFACLTAPLIHDDECMGWLLLAIPARFVSNVQAEDLAGVSSVASWFTARFQEIVHQQKLGELAARIQSEQIRYRNFYRNTPAMLYSIDAERRIYDVSDLFLQHFGYTREDILGRHVSTIMEEESAHYLNTIIYPQYRQDRYADNLPMRLLNKAGFPVEVEISACMDNVQHTIAVVSDVTERNAALRALERKNDELERVNKELKHFTHIASHDLQEPLRKIRSFADILLQAIRENDQNDVRFALNVMTGAAGRASALVSDLLAYSRLSYRAINWHMLDMGWILDDIINDLSVTIQEAEADIAHDLKDVQVRADRTQIRQLLQNLVANALKYRAPDRAPHIRIEAEKNLEGLAVHVRDNGIGLDPSHREKVFEPFARLHDRNQYEGTGIGLAIAAKVCERHGWHLSCTGEMGKGTVFTIAIPWNDGPVANVQTPA